MTADIEKLKSEQGANITYLRVQVYAGDSPNVLVLRKEVERACDDIEAYREIMGLLLKAEAGLSDEDEERYESLLAAMTWGNGGNEG